MMNGLNDLHIRKTLYPEYEKILDLHGYDHLGTGGDMSICLDAHDLVIKKPFLELILLTDDEDFFKAKDTIEEITKITEVVC